MAFFDYRCPPVGGLTCAQKTIPLVYDESLSYEQQIAHIFSILKNWNDSLSAYLTRSDFQEFIKQYNDEQASQTKELKTYTDEELIKLRAELIALIDSMVSGFEIWNVTAGKFSQNVDGMRAMFNDVTVHGVSVDQLANLNYTVDTLTECGLNCRGLAIYGEKLDGATVPEGIYS